MNYYPDRVFPETPQFPVGNEDSPTGTDLYDAIKDYITALTTEVDTNSPDYLDGSGNIEIAAARDILWDSVVRISIVGGEIKVTALQINVEFVVDALTLTGLLTCTGDLIVGGDLGGAPTYFNGTIALTGSVTGDVFRDVSELTQAAEPGDPADDEAVFWISNGTGYGDAGDFCCKITEGGGTTDFTISDYSAL